MHKHTGFKILDVVQLQNWKNLEISPSIRLITQELCPADNQPLKTICTLIGQQGKQRMRIGCCAMCGYVGYIDRPPKEWAISFYLDTYSFHKNSRRKTYKSGPRLLSLLNVLHSLPVDKNRAVCEIGCGTGGYLAALRAAGFSKLIGIENSRYRAEAARRNYGLSVLTTPFESSQSISQLEKEAPFGLIYSHHVLEHVYDPNEVIAHASRLQKEGDYFINSLPNFSAESSLNVLLFLPHLHSFTKESFCALLRKYGYEIIDDTLTTDAEIYLAARKREGAINAPPVKRNYFDEALLKLRNGMGLMGDNVQSVRYLSCKRKTDVCRQSPVFFRGKLSILNRVFCRFHHASIGAHYCLLINGLKNRYTSETDSPLEIQFEDNIKLFYK